ncbi:MAG: asparagine synthase (glutamine-hydrolyzing) [Candidatus Omnitrophota bacterium]
MCGICGKVYLDNRKTIDNNIINRMCNVLKHRGPDGGGIFVDGNVGLGHRRLKIIDLSQAANQPMSNEEESIWIVCNGEIYNFRQLRSNLERKSHIFKSNTDIEVIIHLYEEVGVECVKQLRGMFAFCLWDNKKRRLLLARDRVGKKPLVYCIVGDSLIFASEIKAILQDPCVIPQVNLNALDDYLTYQYVPAPETMFLGIKKLPPAHIMVYENGKINIEKYWSLDYRNKTLMRQEEICQRLLEILKEATRIRLISDVPLGVFLSGGIDSSAIVSLMSEVSSEPIKTFSIGFEEESFNELQYAQRISRIFNTKHREFIVKPQAADILPKLIWHFNEPFADSSCIPTYYLSKMTREEVTVALNGDGGDESFAGYERYVANKLAAAYDLIPLSLRKIFNFLILDHLSESTNKKDFIKRLKRFTKVNSDPKQRYSSWMSIFDEGLKRDLYSKEFIHNLNYRGGSAYIREAYHQAKADNFLDATLSVDVATYLAGDLLVKMDIASMANSLEARSPFLDQEVMEFAASIPANLKLNGWTTKYILKKAFAHRLPKEILNRVKAGFAVPIGSWFRKELKDYAYNLLLDNRAIRRGYFRKGAIQQILDEHINGKIDHGGRIWSLINLELWHQIFIDRTISTNGC